MPISTSLQLPAPMRTFEIPRNSSFRLVLPALVDDETGDYFDFTGWNAVMEVRTAAGTLVALLASDPAELSGATVPTGTISLGTDGVVEFQMSQDETTNLQATEHYANGVASMLSCDVLLVDPQGDRWSYFQGRCTVYQGVTSL